MISSVLDGDLRVPMAFYNNGNVIAAFIELLDMIRPALKGFIWVM